MPVDPNNNHLVHSATYHNTISDYNHREAMKTYFPNGYEMSLAMRRARRIYFWPNVRGWAVIGALVSAVYFYSIEAVAQDDFGDLTPLIPSQADRDAIPSLEDLTEAREARQRARRNSATAATLTPVAPPPAPTPSSEAARLKSAGAFGLGPKMSLYWPKGVAGEMSPLVRGAPDLDRLGSMGDRSTGSAWDVARRV